MGRTVATMTQVVDQEAANFSQFRRALRKEDQEILDRLFAAARHHAAPAAYQSHASPFETILLATLPQLGTGGRGPRPPPASTPGWSTVRGRGRPPRGPVRRTWNMPSRRLS